MTQAPGIEPVPDLVPQGDDQPTLTNPCESCGSLEARYVVADLQERDTSLFCPPCIVLTFAKVASEIGSGADS